MGQTITFAYSNQPIQMQLDKLNRHGIIAGATGTGKTITLKVLAEQFSAAGIPVFLSDIKGDLMSLVEANTGDGLEERLAATHYEAYAPQAFPIEVWDVLGKEGTPLRMTISEMGPILLTKILGLNDVQESILNIVFDVADKQGLLLIDLMDLRAMLNYVADHAEELREYYGNIAKSSVGAILRSLVVLEQQGGNVFFGEPNIDIKDFFTTDAQGQGMVNILNAKELFKLPTLYSMVLFAILSELFEVLPEEGDVEKPKMVFFFDEAHTLFKDTPQALVEKIELVVRLIRSKGVGVFFVTQNPTDIPDSVANQLGNRIQHGLRSYTPKEIRTLSAVADTFRQLEGTDLTQVIQALEVGEAVVSCLAEDGSPQLAEKALIYPPLSKIGTIDPSILLRITNQSPFYRKYSEPVNRQSAHEQIIEATKAQEAELLRKAEEAHIAEAERIAQETTKAQEKLLKEQAQAAEKAAKRAAKEAQRSSSRRTDSAFDRFTKNMMSQVGREIGRVITRSVTGMFKK